MDDNAIILNFEHEKTEVVDGKMVSSFTFNTIIDTSSWGNERLEYKSPKPN